MMLLIFFSGPRLILQAMHIIIMHTTSVFNSTMEILTQRERTLQILWTMPTSWLEPLGTGSLTLG